MPDSNHPLARYAALTVQPMAEETIVYDHRDDSTYALNLTTARVWQLSDGRHSPAEMAQILSAEFGAPVSPELVWYALDKLEKAHLLEKLVPRPAHTSRMTRRDFIKSAGAASLIAVPVILRVHAPAPADASSCKDC